MARRTSARMARVKPESSVFALLLVIPAKAGIQFLLCFCSSFQRKLESSFCFGSSFRRKPESSVFAFCSSLRAKASTRLRRAAYFLCSCKESRQRNTPQRLAPIGHPAQWVRVIGRVPLIAHPVQQRNARDPSRAPYGPDRPLPPQGHGAPGRARARASCAQKQRSISALLLILGPVSRGKVRPESPVGSRAGMRASSRMGRMPIERTPA